MKEFLTILFIYFLCCGCKKKAKEDGDAKCQNNILTSTVNGSVFQAEDLSIVTGFCQIPCPLTKIHANIGEQPHNTTMEITINNSIPGKYYLGKLGTKRDSTNYYTGEAFYSISYSASTGDSYRTDSIFNGEISINLNDEENKRMSGTFSFTGGKIKDNDTLLLNVTNGVFEGCYY